MKNSREKEFDEKFGDFGHLNANFKRVPMPEEIKTFIFQIEQEAIERTQREMVEKIKKIHEFHYMKWVPTEEQIGYRNAQMDIVKLLSQKQEK